MPKEGLYVKAIVVVCAILAVAMLAGCATTESAFQPSAVMPGVETKIGINADANGNSHVQFKVKHLAPPNSLVPPKSFYVVWSQNAEGRSVPLGRLWIGANRDGSFEATLPFIEFRLILTAETELVPEKPSEPFVLVTELLKPEQHPTERFLQ
jgi:hypothetical protein